MLANGRGGEGDLKSAQSVIYSLNDPKVQKILETDFTLKIQASINGGQIKLSYINEVIF